MPAHSKQSVSPGDSSVTPLTSFAALFAGVFLMVAIVKWGNPVILDALTVAPKDFWEFIITAWPTYWAFWAMVPVLLVCIPCVLAGNKQQNVPSAKVSTALSPWQRWLVWLPLVWFAWQLITATQTVNKELTFLTVRHFLICVLMFYIGCFAMRGERNNRLIWVCLILGVIMVMRSALDQHFGGLADMQRYFKSQPNWEQASPDFIKRLNSGRVYATFCYPNSLAGLLLLLVPVSMTVMWRGLDGIRERVGTRLVWLGRLGVIVFDLAAAACLFWSGSKAGWLLALVMGVIALLHLRIPRQVKWGLVIAMAVVGLVGFGIKYAGFFKKGATSVTARFDYWNAAVQIFQANPMLGSGPGTFQVGYSRLKAPDAEFTRLCHNDVLEQACDSGIPGVVTYGGFVVFALVGGYRLIRREKSAVFFAVWLGVLGLTLHSLVDFHLYIPALAWTMFFLFGWMCARIRRSSVRLEN